MVMVASVIVCRVLFAAGVHPQLNLAKKNRCFPLPKKALALVHLWALTPLPHHTQQDTKAMHKARRTQDKQSKCTSPTPTPPRLRCSKLVSIRVVEVEKNGEATSMDLREIQQDYQSRCASTLRVVCSLLINHPCTCV